jgi:hypothetical protein
MTVVILLASLAAGAHAASPPPGCRTLTSAASAPCPLGVEVHVAQKNMPNLAASEVPLAVGCLSGTTLTGGGILQDKVDGGQPINGLRIHGTYPTGKGPGSKWTALGGFGGQSEPGPFPVG